MGPRCGTSPPLGRPQSEDLLGLGPQVRRTSELRLKEMSIGRAGDLRGLGGGPRIAGRVAGRKSGGLPRLSALLALGTALSLAGCGPIGVGSASSLVSVPLFTEPGIANGLNPEFAYNDPLSYNNGIPDNCHPDGICIYDDVAMWRRYLHMDATASDPNSIAYKLSLEHPCNVFDVGCTGIVGTITHLVNDIGPGCPSGSDLGTPASTWINSSPDALPGVVFHKESAPFAARDILGD